RARDRRLLQRVRVPEPGVRELLLALRRAPAEGRAGRRDDADVRAGGCGGALRARRARARGAGARRARGRRQGGGELPAGGPPHADRPLARLRRLPRRRDGVAEPRGADRGERPFLRGGPGVAERDVRQPPADRPVAAPRRRRAAGRQVPADVHRMTSTAPQQRERLLRIGEVVRRLHDEFPDISISKIRYLEDEGLLTPRRTQGGYRLFSAADLERLQKILRLQRDEFLPLRVIKDELDAPGAKERKRRRPTTLGAEEETITFDELCERAGVPPDLAKELEDFGLLAPVASGGVKRYPESDAD